MIKNGYMSERYEKYHKIFCFTCKVVLGRKRDALNHKGHDVDYVKEDGTRDA